MSEPKDHVIVNPAAEIQSHVFVPGRETDAERCAFSPGPGWICGELKRDHMRWPLAPIPPKRVAIVGFSDQSRDQAPFADPSFEIWSLGSHMQRVPRLTRGFEFHSDSFLQRVHGEKWPEFQAFLKRMTVPLYRQEGQPYEGPWERGIEVAYPSAIRYPIERATKAAFGIEDPFGERKPLWTNSVQYMLVLAALEGFQEVHLYGVDMAHRLEYVLQRHGVTFILGLMMGRGINVHLPENCALLHSDHVYAYQEDPAEVLEEAAQHLMRQRESRMSQHADTLAKLHSLDGYTEGMTDAVEYLRERARGGRVEKPLPAEFMK